MPESDRCWRERGLRDAILAGDEHAWRTLYDECFAPLLAYARWRCGGRNDLADEVVQETWLVAVRRVRGFDPQRTAFLNWLRGIAANLIRNHLRRPWPKPLEQEALAVSREKERERAEEVARALAGLPERYEAVLRDKYLDQLSVEEIAKRSGQSAKAVESLLSRAREAFRRAYPMPEMLEKPK